MGFLKLFKTVLLVFFFQCFGWSQIAMDDIQIWFDQSKESNAVSITSNFLSEAEDLIVLNYKIYTSVLQDQNLRVIDLEKGEFLAAQNLPIPLGTRTIEIDSIEKIILKVEILQEEQLLIAEEFVWNREELGFKNNEVTEVRIQKKIESNLQIQKNEEVEKQTQKNLKTKIVGNQGKKTTNFDAIEIQGLIIDETRSKIGRDFYEIFFRKWIPPNGSKGDFIITIKELPAFGRSSRIALDVDGQSLGIRNLTPRLEYVEQQVNSSIRQARKYLTQRSNISRDLENEDTSGSGIF